MRQLRYFYYVLLFLGIFLNKNSFAQNLQIEVIGNQRLSAEEIYSYLDVESLKNANQQAINKALKNLYGLEYFSKVKIYQKKNSIIIEIKENPIVKEVIFLGNKKIDDDILLSEIRLNKRSIYTKAKLESDIKRINNIYIKSGRFLAKINPKIELKDDNRINIIFEISEGKRAKVRKIHFIGNGVFSDSDLLQEITTRPSKWYKFFSSSDIYDSDRMEFDKEKLRRFYNSKGYADFNVISANAQINRKKDQIFINFLLEEGIKYNFGKINIVNNVRGFDKSLLNKKIFTKKGKIYNYDLIDKTIDKFTNILSENGYAFTNIRHVLKKNKEQKSIDISYIIEEAPRIYINEINITGNSRTLDKVIRRELRFRQGDPYNIIKINRSKQRINNLGFFEKVDLKTNRIGNSDKVNIEIEVSEKKTGELNFGIGYSTIDQMTGNIGLKERNLFGTGREVSVNLQKSSFRNSNQISYTKPYFLQRDLSVGVDLFNYELDKLDTLIYDQKSIGASLRAGYNITEYIYHLLKYSYRDEKVSDIDDDASLTIQNLEGKFVNSAISHSLSLDKRDSRFNPKNGYYANLIQTYAGVGGDIEYIKQEGSASYYIPIINEDFILKFSGKFGYIDGIGQHIRSNDNFFLGGNNFRGFEYAGLGPRTITSNGTAVGGDAVGGKLYYISNTEFKFPLGLPKDLGINAALFHTAGTLKMFDDSNTSDTEIADSGLIRSSYGLSIIWSSPLGPISLDFSKIAKSEDYDRTENFRFSFGTTF